MPSDAPQESASTHDAVASTSAQIENTQRIRMMFGIPRASMSTLCASWQIYMLLFLLEKRP